MLQDAYLSVMSAKSRDELHADVLRFTAQLGFEKVAAMAVIDHVTGDPEFTYIDNAPAGYRAVSQDRNTNKRDPVMQHCKTQSVPIIWDRSTYIKANQVAKWELQASFGYHCGISVAMHLPQGRHFALGVDRDQALPSDPAEVTRMTAAVQLFAVYAQEAAMRILVPASAEPDVPALTPRELECLRWTMEGKTAWELGRILDIAEQTAVRHIHNAARKLGSVNKHQAVLKALRLKLIG